MVFPPSADNKTTFSDKSKLKLNVFWLQGNNGSKKTDTQKLKQSSNISVFNLSL